MSNLLEGNIKTGVTIAGVEGKYPSAAYSLEYATSVADLTAPTFDAKMKSDTTFEWFDSEGVRYTGAGDSDLNTPANIADGVTIFRMTGAAANIAAEAWDLRAGVTVAGVTGKLKVACRNSVSFSGTGSYNNTISPASASLTVGDIWDTIDDYYGFPSSVRFPPIWSAAQNYCGNIDPNTPSDDDVWVDVTTNGSSASTCADTPANCTMKDRISGLKWSKLIGTNVLWHGSPTTGAIPTCHALAHNGQAAGSWRLPTQKELLNAYTHGIAGIARTNWIPWTTMQGTFFWSATSYSGHTGGAWLVNLAHAEVNFHYSNKANYGTYSIVCVQ